MEPRRALKRVQVPGDLLGTLLYLAGPGSDVVTGQTLVVGGGDYLHEAHYRGARTIQPPAEALDHHLGLSGY